MKKRCLVHPLITDGVSFYSFPDNGKTKAYLCSFCIEKINDKDVGAMVEATIRGYIDELAQPRSMQKYQPIELVVLYGKLNTPKDE